MEALMNELKSEEFKNRSYFEVACDAPLLAETFRNSLIFSDRNDEKNLERNLSFISKITRCGTHMLWSIRLLNRIFFDHSSLLNHWTLIQKIIRYMAMKKSFIHSDSVLKRIFWQDVVDNSNNFILLNRLFFILIWDASCEIFIEILRIVFTIYLKDFGKWSLFILVKTCR